MISIDRYVYANKLIAVHPAEKFLMAIATMVVCLGSTSIYTPLIVLVFMAGLTIINAGIPSRFYFDLLGIPITFLLISLLTIAFSISSQSSDFLYHWSVGGIFIGVTSQNLNTAIIMFIKSLGAVSCLYFLALTTPMLEIIFVLRKLKVPALFVELMSLIYRFIFVLLDSAATIHTAQSSRLGYVNLKSSFHSTSQLFYALLIRSVQRSQAVATALESRCYQGEIRVLEKKFLLSKRRIAFIIIVESGLILSNVYFKGGTFFG